MSVKFKVPVKGLTAENSAAVEARIKHDILAAIDKYLKGIAVNEPS